MSKRRRGGDSSLELLLDTICNTFGGVLFVAILIVIMLRMTSKSEAEGDSSQVSEAEQLELKRQQAELEGTAETLRQATEGFDEPLKVADSAAAELVNELKNQQQARQNLLQDRLKTLDSIVTHQARINEAARENEQHEKREQATRGRKSELEATLRTEIASRSQQVEYSRARQSGKQEIPALLRYGRFYLLYRYGAAGHPLGLNTDEFIVLDETLIQTRTTPMPHAGTVVADGPQATRELNSKLDAFHPERDYIAVLVWPDSFEHFGVLKKVLVQRGFEYRLIPAKDGGEYSNRGGSRDGVQ